MKRILYLGTDPSHFSTDGHLIHYPVIQIVPRSLEDPSIISAFAEFPSFTHLIFTSKNAVSIFCSYLETLSLSHQNKQVIAVGQVTAQSLQKQGMTVNLVATTETQEGIIECLDFLHLTDAYLFLPKSSLSRPVLTQYLMQKNIRHFACDFYDTVTQKPGPLDLKEIDEIVFTSPSTVKAFLEIFGEIPQDKKLCVLGPITKQTLETYLTDRELP